MSTVPGSNNLAVVSGAPTLSSNLVCQPPTILTTAVTPIPVALPVQTKNNAASICSVSLNSNFMQSSSTQSSEKQNELDSQSESVINKERTKLLENQQPESIEYPLTPSSGVTKVTIHSTQNPVTTVVTSSLDETGVSETGAKDEMVIGNGESDLTSDHSNKNSPGEQSNPGVTVKKNTSCVDSSDTDSRIIFNGPPSLSSNSNAQNHHDCISNGFLEQEDSQQ